MRPERVGQSRWMVGAVLFIFMSVLPVCGGPKVNIKADEKLDSYSRVYFAPIRNDAANVRPKLLDRLKKAGFEAEEIDPNKSPFGLQGTGFVLTSAGHVLTCAHVVGNESEATLWVQGHRYLAHVLTVDTNLDAALLRIDGSNAPFNFLTFVADTNYHLGQEVFTLGFPLADLLGKSPRLNKGMINATSGMGDVPWKLQISAEVQPGSSGGPMLNQQGEVLGMVDSTINPSRVWLQTGGDLPQNVNFAIKDYPLREFLAASHLTLPAATNLFGGFEEVAKSITLIRSGIIDEKRLQEKALACLCTYSFGQWKQLMRVRIAFLDLRKLKVVLLASIDQDPYPYTSPDVVLDGMFAEICDKFFPAGPNAFRAKKTKSKSKKY